MDSLSLGMLRVGYFNRVAPLLDNVKRQKQSNVVAYLLSNAKIPHFNSVAGVRLL